MMDAQFVMFKENGERKEFALRNQTTIVGRQINFVFAG